MRDIEFYQEHLDRVSRSFAFCIRKLPHPMRDWTSLSYLICRVLDTIEDSPWKDLSLRNQQYQEFENFLKGKYDYDSISTWSERFPRMIPQSERKLLSESFYLFNDLYDCPTEVRQVILQSVFKMLGGMKYYAERQRSERELRLTSILDVNRYCYFVAGVVGELLSGLLILYRGNFQPETSFKLNAIHFGLFLQKVNLLKDQRSDESEGRFLVPDRNLLLSSLRDNAKGAMDYLSSLPQDEVGYRTFCAWSMFLGAASLPWIQKSFHEESETKISRTLTEQLLTTVEQMVTNDTMMRSALSELLMIIPENSFSSGALEQSHDSELLSLLHQSSLQTDELSLLRMI